MEKGDRTMQILQERIRKDGQVLPGEIVKVDGFLNHRMDVGLIDMIGEEFHRVFADVKPTVIVTIEASGIAMAYATAQKFGIPVIFAKKGKAKNIGNDIFSADVFSYTRGTTYGVHISKKFLSSEDRVLIIDDILANAQAALGLISICHQAQAKVVGIGIVIEKKWQRGSELLRSKGLPLHSLAVITRLENGKIFFEDDESV